MTRFRFLQTGDIHIGKGRALWGEDMALSRAAYTFDRLYQCAIEQKCSAILVTGDIFDTKSPLPSERELLVEKLVRYAGKNSTVHWYLIPGNHDVENQKQDSALDFLAPISEAKEIPNLHLVRASRYEVWEAPVPGLRIVGAPAYWSETTEQVFTVADTLDKNISHVFMGHGHVGGSLMNDRGFTKDSKLSLARAAQYPNIVYWAYGDIHKKQPLATLTGDAKGYYAGSPIQMAFDEPPGRGALVVALDSQPNGTWKVVGTRFQEIDQDLPKLVTVTSESQFPALLPTDLVKLEKGLFIPKEKMDQVVSTFKVVDNQATVEAVANIIVGDVVNGVQDDTVDPLLQSVTEVEDEVLKGLDEEDRVVARGVVASAIEAYKNRVYVS